MSSSTDQRTAALEARLSGLKGLARIGTLVELGQARMRRCWEERAGSPAGRPALDGAIAAFDEAYALIPLGDPMRGRIAGMAGWLYGVRYSGYGRSGHDRDTGIHLLTEALAFADLPPVLRHGAWLVLAQLHLARAGEGIGQDTVRGTLLGGRRPPAADDADRAVGYLHEILDADSVSPEITGMARAMVTMAETLQTVLGATGQGIGGLDFGRLIQAMGEMQKLKERLERPGGQGYGMFMPTPDGEGPAVPSFAGVDALFDLDPMDYPVAVVQTEEPAAAPEPDLPPVAPVAVDEGATRLALRAAVARLAKVPDATAVDLLRPDLVPPPAGAVDECVALASIVVHSGQSVDPAGTGTDRYLLAVALYLRAALSPGGWADDDAAADLRAGAGHLLAAAETLPSEHPVTVRALLGLGAFLDERYPLRGAPDGYAERFRTRADAVLATGTVSAEDLATVHALRCLCGVAAGTGTPDREAVRGLERAVGAVPAGYGWRARLRVAAGYAALVSAVAEDDPVAARRAVDLYDVPRWPAGARTVLRALLDDDEPALRAAVAELAREPELAAVAGGVFLRLGDVPAAIDALERTGEAQRPGTLWRLAEAYRRRAGTGDPDRARDCAVRAARWPAPEPGAPLRYASLVLAGGRTDEALAALEAAASSRTYAVPALGVDLVRALGAPGPDRGTVPATLDEVCGALRAVGADVLVYPHRRDGWALLLERPGGSTPNRPRMLVRQGFPRGRPPVPGRSGATSSGPGTGSTPTTSSSRTSGRAPSSWSCPDGHRDR